MEINIPRVETIVYEFKCSGDQCQERVVGTLPALTAYGWLDVSTFDKPNRWLCPVHGRGFVKAEAEATPRPKRKRR